MRRLGTIWLRLRSLLRRRAADADVDDELRFHLESTIEENVARGLTPEEARRQALLDLGGPEQVKEACREARPWRWLEDTWRDVRYGARAAQIARLRHGCHPNARVGRRREHRDFQPC